MNPLIRFLVDLLGLTEEQVAKLKTEQQIKIEVGQLFMNGDPTVMRVGPRDLCRMCLNLPSPVMHELMCALTKVYQTMDAAAAEQTQTPSTRPWTLDDKVPN